MKGALLNMTAKQKGSRWSFPKDTEIFKCREGNKEFLRERTSGLHKSSNYQLVAEFPVYDSDDSRKTAWKMAKRVARDFLRTTWAKYALICYTERDTYQRKTVKVYQKLEL